MAAMLGKLANMRLRSGRLKPGREKRLYQRVQRAREKRPGSMFQPFIFAGDENDDAQRVPFRPVGESEDEW